MASKVRIITVAGKGGVGKTSIAATIVRLLVDSYPDKKILAIDADPAVGLSTALDVEVVMSIDDIRRAIIENVEDGNAKDAIEMLGEVRYKIVDAMVEKDGFEFISVGRPETAGCYCKINSYLKEVISMVSEQYDYVVIDGEAGIEQINRRVMEKVTDLILISDPSKKGRQVIATIKRVADELVMYDKVGVIINRLTDESLMPYVTVEGLNILAFIGDDKNLSTFDVQGKSIFNLPSDTAVVAGVKSALIAMDILSK